MFLYCQGKSGGSLQAAARSFGEGITCTKEQICAQQNYNRTAKNHDRTF